MTTTETPARRRPWQARRPRPRRPDVVAAPEAQPLAELRIYPDMVLLTRRGPAGSWRSYPVSPDALAQTLARQPATTGLLPPHTLGAGRVAGEPFTVVWRPAQVSRLQTERRTYQIPLPPLVWAGCGSRYRIFALAQEEAPTRDVPLMQAPFPNVYRDGQICWGNVAGVAAATGAEQLLAVRRLFLEDSAFNTHVADGKSARYTTSILALWQELDRDGVTTYPLDDLQPSGYSLGWLLGGRAWTR